MAIQNFSLEAFSLAGKVALITGGNSGLGEAFTLALSKAGASVFVVSVEEDRACVDHLSAQGKPARQMRADLREAGVPKAAIQQCVDEFARLDILVNCAGVNLLAEVDEFGRELWDATIQVNLTAAFEMSFHAVPFMREQGGGKIINVCSVYSFLGGRGSPAYAASKHGIAGLTKAYCDELAADNIQVNGIAPGYFATKLTEQTRSNPETNTAVLEHIPAGRWGEREDLMGAVVFLASNASNYVNGHILSVDGGYLVR